MRRYISATYTAHTSTMTRTRRLKNKANGEPRGLHRVFHTSFSPFSTIWVVHFGQFVKRANAEMMTTVTKTTRYLQRMYYA